MVTRRTVVLSLLAAGAIRGAASAQESTQATKSASRRPEIEALRRFAESTHPRGREAAADADWRSRWDSLVAESDRLTDGAYFVRLRRALGWFRDGHTTVLPFEFTGMPEPLARGAFAYSLPLSVRVFHDGARIIAATGDAANFLGARIMRVGRMTDVELIRAFAEQWPGNDAWAHRWSAQAFTPAHLEALSAVDAASAEVTLETEAGAARLWRSVKPTVDRTVTLRKLARTQTEVERWASSARTANFVHAIAERRALYLGLDEMSDVEGKTFEAFTREAFAAMSSAGVARLIVDLRRNGGGNNFLAEALRRHIGRSHFNRPGGLYVLIGPRTFSAAQNCATRLERETFAIFVGEPTGGAPNHYGDAAIFTGEVTGIKAMVSSLPWFDSYPQDRRPWILPDLPVPETFDDWQAGRDVALDTALAHETSAVADDLDRGRIFFYSRKSQRADWKPFWRPESNAP